jgi:hypothetical protein
MNRLAAAALVATILCALDCSSSSQGGTSSCATNGSCPNRAAPDPAEVMQCESALSDPKCGGAFQIYFDCAFRQEKCTTAGVTDDAATRAAIMANCSTEANAYRSCAGASTTTTCGLTGLAYCTDGHPPCASTNCCDPATNKCRGLGEACTGAGTVCAANQCAACGAPGQPCCHIEGTNPNPCPSGGCCNYSAGQQGGSCIAEGGQCDAPGPNTTEKVCRSGSCITCGGSFGYCCAGAKCMGANMTCTSGMCR